MSLQPVILSGGSGTRLWPLSRESYPKQFLPLISEHTMLQETVRRLDGLAQEHPRNAIGVRDPIVVCNDAHRFLVAEQFRLMGRRTASIILEPMGRNTAPALTLAAMQTVGGDWDPVLLVMPADHTILHEHDFRRVVADGYVLANQGAVVTFGIVPKKPETGYGYLRQGEAFDADDMSGDAFHLQAFVEKPDQGTAEEYLVSGDYLWNSGIFMMKASLWLTLIERFRPDIARACRVALDQGSIDGEFQRLNVEAFNDCPSDSIDYAVMERLTAEEAKQYAPAVVLGDFP